MSETDFAAIVLISVSSGFLAAWILFSYAL